MLPLEGVATLAVIVVFRVRMATAKVKVLGLVRRWMRSGVLTVRGVPLICGVEVASVAVGEVEGEKPAVEPLRRLELVGEDDAVGVAGGS